MATKKSTKKNVKKEVKKEEMSTDFVEKKKTKRSEVVEKKKEVKKVESKSNKHLFTHMFLILLLITSLVSFVFNILNKDISILGLITSLLITIFTISFVITSITYHRKKKGIILLSGLLLFSYLVLNISNNFNVVNTEIGVKNFQGANVTEVMKWASKNDIKVNQEYEYSDMIEEYKVISQSKLKNNEITIAVSEGPNPFKETIVPSMVTWDDERVINFVKDNHLTNVAVEFVASDMAKDTVIEQSVSGNLRRNDELKLTFSFGEELGFSEVKLIDFTKKSKFEVEFFMKQHQLNYEFNEDFSNSIKRGYTTKQSIKAGEMVPINSDPVVITISKGPKVKVPDLNKMDLEELTEWAIKNKVKLVFTDQYDESVKENEVIGFDKEKDSIIEQGSVIKVILSRGALKMPKFNNINDFYDWANKYNIKYEEKHEFSNSIKAGEIISFSYKTGQKIKNNDIIIVTISDGEKKELPSLIGLTKSEAITKLERAGLKYSFIYRASSHSKNKVIDQSISAGSEISSGTTITVTVSSGEAEDTSSGNSTNNRRTTPTNNPTPTPTPTCSNEIVWIEGSHISPGNPNATCSNIKNAHPKLKFSCVYVSDGEYIGALVNSEALDGRTFSTCSTITLRIRNK